ncbi:MAG: hypothetical protein EOP04_15025 [Proteobacteria bacterium]|nr:MAG: hypothetical protein EOP04_15025 [Pseudomonadota bacterium]
MLVLVEGVDKAGKSTLIKHLTKWTGIPSYRKFVPPMPDSEHHVYFKGVAHALVDLHNTVGLNLIVDRSFPSDWVYTNKHNQSKPFEIWNEWESRVNCSDTLILYVSIDQKMFNQRISDDPDPYMGIEDYPHHTALYEAYLERTSIPVIRVDGAAPSHVQKQILSGYIGPSSAIKKLSTLLNQDNRSL